MRKKLAELQGKDYVLISDSQDREVIEDFLAWEKKEDRYPYYIILWDRERGWILEVWGMNSLHLEAVATRLY